MYLIVSSDNTKDRILKIIKSNSLPYFVYFRTTYAFEDLLNEPPSALYPHTVIFEELDRVGSIKKLCAEVKQKHPDITVGAILSENLTKASLFRYIPEADEEIISPFSDNDFINFMEKLHSFPLPSISPNLICSHKASYLLGYDMKLSPGENRILVFLATFNNLKLNANTICEFCFNTTPDKGSIAKVRVIINHINKKANNISGRSIILNSYENGYYINPEL